MTRKTIILLILAIFGALAIKAQNIKGLHYIPRKNNRITIQKQKKQAKQKKSQILFREGFDSQQFPPKNWSDSTTNDQKTWERHKISHYSFDSIVNNSKASAICEWSFYKQDEWLITPMIDARDHKSISIDFYAGFSEDWLDKASLSLYISADTSSTWERIWNAREDTSDIQQWTWKNIRKYAIEYAGTRFQLAWRYSGKRGDLVALDNIKVFGGEAPTGTDILEFKVPGHNEEVDIDTENHTINVEIAKGTDITDLTPQIEISPGARIEPPSGEPQSFQLKEPFQYTVYAADSSVEPQIWEVIITLTDINTNADILDFTVENQTKEAKIDTAANEVHVEVKYHTKRDTLTPDITISPGASIVPESGEPQDFEDGVPVKYTVTPQDPDAPVQQWKVFISKRDYLNDILSFSLNNQTHPAEIDTLNNIIKAEIQSDANPDSLKPAIEVSPGASVEPDSGERVSINPDSNTPFEYVVTAANGDTSVWRVFLSKSIDAILKAEFDADTTSLPQGWKRDSSNKTHSWTIQKLPSQPFSAIDKYSSASALCPWSLNKSDEWLLSPYVKLPANKDIKLRFYAGFSKHWIDSANLYLKVRTKTNDEWDNLWDISHYTTSDKNWKWRNIAIDLSTYKDKTIQLAWQYKGRFGDLVGIDNVYVAKKEQFENTDAKNTSVRNPGKPKPEITIYPNPFKSNIHIKGFSGLMKIVNLHGKIIKTKRIHSGNTTINLSTLPNRVYLVILKSPENSYSQKIIKY